jgi:hypothetical protein
MVRTPALANSSWDLGPTPLRYLTSEWIVVSAAMAASGLTRRVGGGSEPR